MSTLWRWFIVILALVLVLAGALLVVRNFQTVSLDIILAQIEVPLILVLLLAFLLGAFMSWVLNAWLLFARKRKIKQLNKQLEDFKQELSQLRQSPMNGIQ